MPLAIIAVTVSDSAVEEVVLFFVEEVLLFFFVPFEVLPLVLLPVEVFPLEPLFPEELLLSAEPFVPVLAVTVGDFSPSARQKLPPEATVNSAYPPEIVTLPTVCRTSFSG